MSLKVDLFHHGKSDESDHKVIHERLLNLAVPPDPDGKGVKLEDCLEEYFNAQVDVLRDSSEDKAAVAESPLTPKPATAPLEDSAAIVQSPASPKPTIRLVSDEDTVASGATTPRPEPSLIPALPRRATLATQTGEEATGASSSSSSPPPLRQRSATIIQRVLIDETGQPANEPTVSTLQRKGSVIVKAITIPAWQFFRLMRMFTPPYPA